MDFELISAQEFDSLPEDDEQCFVAFEAICRRNMTKMINSDTSANFDHSVQAQYVAVVSSVAIECGLAQLARSVTAQNHDEFYEKFSEFSLAVQGEVARIRFRGRRSRDALSVQLTDSTRIKIQFHIARLLETIEKSDLPGARKAALKSRVDELAHELENRRLSLGKTMATLSFVLVGLASVTTIGAEGPAAVTNIMKLIGVDKESEETAAARLAPPPKALPAPVQNPSMPRENVATSWDVSRGGDLDEEIPF